MQTILDIVSNDIALMFIIYIAFCLFLMYLFIRADNEWNQRESDLSQERMRLLSSDEERSERLYGLNDCLAHHDVNCTCFLQPKERQKKQDAQQEQQLL